MSAAFLFQFKTGFPTQLGAHQLSRLAGWLHRSVPVISTRVANACHSPRLCGFCRSELRSSWLCSRHFTSWAISPAPINFQEIANINSSYIIPQNRTGRNIIKLILQCQYYLIQKLDKGITKSNTIGQLLWWTQIQLVLNEKGKKKNPANWILYIKTKWVSSQGRKFSSTHTNQ